MPLPEAALGWFDADPAKNRYPEDDFLRWVWRHPRATLLMIFGSLSVTPFVIGLALGAWIF